MKNLTLQELKIQLSVLTWLMSERNKMLGSLYLYSRVTLVIYLGCIRLILLEKGLTQHRFRF